MAFIGLATTLPELHCLGYYSALVRLVSPACRPRYNLEDWKTRLRGTAVVFGDEFSNASCMGKSVEGKTWIKPYQ
jgi:hypothetical protein